MKFGGEMISAWEEAVELVWADLMDRWRTNLKLEVIAVLFTAWIKSRMKREIKAFRVGMFNYLSPICWCPSTPAWVMRSLIDFSRSSILVGKIYENFNKLSGSWSLTDCPYHRFERWSARTCTGICPGHSAASSAPDLRWKISRKLQRIM